MADPKALTREQFSKFLKTPEEIKLFERLFEQAGDILPAEFQQAVIDANSALSKSQSALDTLNRIADSLELLALSPVDNDVDSDDIDIIYSQDCCEENPLPPNQDINYATLYGNGSVGTASNQVAAGNHTHTGVYVPYAGFIDLPKDQEPLQWDGATTGVTLSGPGSADIEGSVLTWNSTISVSYTPSTAGVKHVYLYDNAGTAALEINDTNVVPLYSDTYKYWYKTGDTSRRRVASIYVWDNAGTKEIIEFQSYLHEDEIEIVVVDTVAVAGGNVCQLVSAGTATSMTSFNLLLAPSDATHWLADARLLSGAANADSILGIHPVTHAAAVATSLFTVRACNPTSGSRTFFGRFWMPKPIGVTTAYYGLQHITSTNSAYIVIHGIKMRI